MISRHCCLVKKLLRIDSDVRESAGTRWQTVAVVEIQRCVTYEPESQRGFFAFCLARASGWY